MDKGKTILAQIMSPINKYTFKKCVDRYRGDRHAIKFSCRDPFLEMSFAQFTDRSGLGDIETTLAPAPRIFIKERSFASILTE